MTNKPKPLISLIIPTRERAWTLSSTLETALNQKTDNYEIVVCDNHSQDTTQAVVEQFRDPRIKYFNTGQRLSMCDNWDFALTRANGSYVLFIGDDDGILPQAIQKLEELIRFWPSLIYYWHPPNFIWPLDEADSWIRWQSPTTSSREVTLRNRVEFSIRWGGLRYYGLPLLYHSLVATSILNQIRKRTGRVFHSTQPDVFSAFALPVFCESAVYLGTSLTAYGTSYASDRNSASCLDSAFGKKIEKFSKEYSDYRIHPTLYPDVPFFFNMIPDAVLVAMDLFPEYYQHMKFNYDAMWAFVQSYWDLSNTLEILGKRSEIRRFHSFSVMRFFVYSFANKLFKLKRTFQEKRCRRETEKKSPKNINDFVIWLSQQECRE